MLTIAGLYLHRAIHHHLDFPGGPHRAPVGKARGGTLWPVAVGAWAGDQLSGPLS